MEKFLIKGPCKLNGRVDVHGAKNSVLPILASTILIDGISVIHNCPRLSDVDVAIKILKHLGAKVTRENRAVIVDASNINKNTIPEGLMREMRSSIIFLASLVTRMKSATLSAPGGCEIGLRPIDLHLSSLRQLGMEIDCRAGELRCNCENKIHGAKIVLSFPSVGATENILIAASVAKGKTTIINAAREPEISDLASFLNKCGAKIYGAGEGTIEIDGVKALKPCEHSVIPDRILASTYMASCAVTGGDILINKIRPAHITPVFPVFEAMGCKLFLESCESLRIKAPKRLRSVKSIKTMPYPGFPTDSQSPVMAALCCAKGTSSIVENIFESRFKNVPELVRLGAKIYVNDKVAVIDGVKELCGANVVAGDLRGGASLVVAALNSRGVTTVTNLEHIDRGYENLEVALSGLGADIKRIYK